MCVVASWFLTPKGWAENRFLKNLSQPFILYSLLKSMDEFGRPNLGFIIGGLVNALLTMVETSGPGVTLFPEVANP